MLKVARDIAIAVFVSLSAVAIALFMSLSQAPAHSWYPVECCSGYDCAPVDKAVASGDGSLSVTTIHGSAMVPPSMRRRDSRDNRMHACIRPDAAGVPRVICIFLPPGI